MLFSALHAPVRQLEAISSWRCGFLVLALLGAWSPTALAQAPFVTTWETTTANESITIPTDGTVSTTAYDVTIDWGDGTVEIVTGRDPDPSHTYASADTYTVSISGTFPRIYLAYTPQAQKLRSIEQWGDIAWESMAFAFAGAENVVLNATDAPDLTRVTHLEGMFSGAAAVDGDLSAWDVSTITHMNGMFSGATSFNGDVSAWDVSNVTTTSTMFSYTDAFNQDISAWDVSSVTDMIQMFREARAFNQDIGGWDVSSVTDMRSMLRDASAFNQNLSAWDVSNVVEMRYMFDGATAFNQDLGDWDVTRVTRFDFFLRNAALSPRPTTHSSSAGQRSTSPTG